jgi:aquaporin Z
MTLDRPNAFARQFDFWNSQYEGRRLFSELLGTFFLVLVAVGGGWRCCGLCSGGTATRA